MAHILKVLSPEKHMMYEWLNGSLDPVYFGHTRILICFIKSSNWSVWCGESDVGFISKLQLIHLSTVKVFLFP